MTLPAAPLPSFSLLLSVLTSPASVGFSWLGHQPKRAVCLYRSGRDALAAAVWAVSRAARKEHPTAWFPAYFCNEALAPLRKSGAQLKFYPIREDLTPDWTILEEMVSHLAAGQVFVLVHYFGFPNDLCGARVFCERRGLKLLEDAAHVLLPAPPIGDGEMQIFSPGKLLPLPEGGILVMPQEMKAHLTNLSGRGNFGATVSWLSRRLAQKILLQFHIPWHLFWKTRSTEMATSANRQPGGDPKPAGRFTFKLLAVLERHMEEVIQRRRSNYKRLLDWARGLALCKPVFPSLPEGVCPYVFPLLLEKGSRSAAAKLQAAGIPASQWPDLPPEVLSGRQPCGSAMDLQRRLLLLPVHQSLDGRQTDEVGRQVDVAINGEM